MALATRPRLLLLDEVAAGLTEGEIEDMARLIRRMRDELGPDRHLDRTCGDGAAAPRGARDRAAPGPQDRRWHPAEVVRDPEVIEPISAMKWSEPA